MACKEDIKNDTQEVIVCFPPDRNPAIHKDKLTVKIFLAGSIEQGKAEEWQKRVIDELQLYTDQLEEQIQPQCHKDIVFFNPRRPDWDASLPQTKINKIMKEQIEWELDHLEKSDIICLYLDPNTKSPISLLELGIHIRSGKLVVCCPEGFYRKANIDITCARYGVDVHGSYDSFIVALKDKINAISPNRKYKKMKVT